MYTMCVSVSYGYFFAYLLQVTGVFFLLCCAMCTFYECFLRWIDSIIYNVYVSLSVVQFL
jgi:hypothetical protein